MTSFSWESLQLSEKELSIIQRQQNFQVSAYNLELDGARKVLQALGRGDE